MSETKLWANSGDSHSLGSTRVWDQILPKALSERMPRSEKFDGYEIVHVDGQSFRREMPTLEKKKAGSKTIGELVMERGADDIGSRLRDLDDEGIWSEIVYDSLGLWESMIEDKELLARREPGEQRVEGVRDRLPFEQPLGAHRVDPAPRCRPRDRGAAARRHRSA